MVVIVEDVIKLLDGVSEATAPDAVPTASTASNVARALRGLADELET